MKLGKLIEYNMRKVFLEKSCTKWGVETILRPISRKSKLRTSLFYAVGFYCLCKSRAIEIYCRQLDLTLYKAF